MYCSVQKYTGIAHVLKYVLRDFVWCSRQQGFAKLSKCVSRSLALHHCVFATELHNVQVRNERLDVILTLNIFVLYAFAY